MATRNQAPSISAPTAAERIAAYRAAAKAIAPAQAAPRTTPSVSAAEVVGKVSADFVSFFGDVRAVYAVERASRQ